MLPGAFGILLCSIPRIVFAIHKPLDPIAVCTEYLVFAFLICEYGSVKCLASQTRFQILRSISVDVINLKTTTISASARTVSIQPLARGVRAPIAKFTENFVSQICEIFPIKAPLLF
jgi:hypothetical protein